MHRLFRYKNGLRVLCVLCLLCCCYLSSQAQYFELEKGRKRVTIPFRFVRNLMVIQLHIDHKGPYNFILDTGVGMMVITEPKLVDSVTLDKNRKLRIQGLGKGEEHEAYVSAPLHIDIPQMASHEVRAAVLRKDPFGLSAYAGIKIHGLLGYEFFNKLSVKISFTDSVITVAQPQHMRPLRKAIKLPLIIEGNKPYIITKVVYEDGTERNSKLIVDLGAGHSLSMENVTDKEKLQKNFISANLGMGITGVINGKISRIKSVKIGDMDIRKVLTSFPDDNSIEHTVPRDGNLGMGLLKRFNLVFDYPNGAMYLKPNMHLREPFEHDMSGLGYYATGDDFDRVIIDAVAPGSAGEEAGLLPYDEITAINFKPADRMSLQQIDDLFKADSGRSFIIDIRRGVETGRVVLTLKRRI